MGVADVDDGVDAEEMLEGVEELDDRRTIAPENVSCLCCDSCGKKFMAANFHKQNI